MQNQSKRDKTRQTIRETFLSLYREKDISKITVTEVCKAAGINRSTFYTYYEDVYALQSSLEEETLTEIAKLILPIFQSMDSILDINKFIDSFLKYSEQNEEIQFLLISRGGDGLMDRFMKKVTGVYAPPDQSLNQAASMKACHLAHLFSGRLRKRIVSWIIRHKRKSNIAFDTTFQGWPPFSAFEKSRNPYRRKIVRISAPRTSVLRSSLP